MTFNSKTVGVLCKNCQQHLLEVHVDGKVFGPYQKIARTNRSNRNETGWLDQETILYHHSVDNTKEGFCSCFGKKDEFSKFPLTFYKVFCKGGNDNSYKEEEKVGCRIIWHEVKGFSDYEVQNKFEFVCANCKRKGDLKSFDDSYGALRGVLNKIA